MSDTSPSMPTPSRPRAVNQRILNWTDAAPGLKDDIASENTGSSSPRSNGAFGSPRGHVYAASTAGLVKTNSGGSEGDNSPPTGRTRGRSSSTASKPALGSSSEELPSKPLGGGDEVGSNRANSGGKLIATHNRVMSSTASGTSLSGSPPLSSSLPNTPAKEHRGSAPRPIAVSNDSMKRAGADSVTSPLLSPSGPLIFSIASAIPVHSSTEKEFTAFMVTVTFPNGESKVILRRYRQFSALHAAVLKRFPEKDLPHFPKKRFLGNMSPSLVEKRRKKLENYLAAISAYPGIDDFLGFTTFLGSELVQRGGKKRKGTGAELPINEDPEETPEEKEHRLATERRYGEVKHCITLVDSWVARLNAVEKSFDAVLETSDFIKLSDYSKLVVVLGKALADEPTELNFTPRELSKELEANITNPKIKSIRQKITPAISELVSKILMIKQRLLDVSFPMEAVLDLMQLVETTLKSVWDLSNLVAIQLGFRIEAGTTNTDKRLPDYVGENVYWYATQFSNKDHLICHNPNSTALGPVVVAIKGEEFTETSGKFRGILCTKDGNEHVLANVNGTELAATWVDKFQDILCQLDLRLRGIEFKICSGAEGQALIEAHEKKDMRVTRKLKFGVLFCKKGQTVEEDMFSNTETSPEFEYFLSQIGTKTPLLGYTGFAGGLDLKGGTTGENSFTNRFKDFQIMYHVSTMLPHGESAQQLAKKRHIGNDIVLVVFQEEGCDVFSPTTVKSNYIQIIIVVRIINLGDGRKAWRVNVASAQDVPEFGPPVPYPPIFTDGPALGEWLVQKMVNGELASYRSKLFVQQLRSTYKTLVTDLTAKLPQTSTLKSKGKGGLTGALQKKKDKQ